MLWETTDMSETPDEILRALADPERLAIAGLLARGSASGPMLAAALDLPVKRVRSHLNRLASAGVVRLNEDHATPSEGVR
jgi:DNA-binding transcriptional ArsR family regulator